MPDVVRTQILLTATVDTAAGWSDVVGTISGAAGSGSVELFADMSNNYSDTVVIEDALDDCVDANGFCTTTWTVTFAHTDGSEVVAVDYAISANVVGPNTNVDVSAY
jgi:hypothetical protein